MQTLKRLLSIGLALVMIVPAGVLAGNVGNNPDIQFVVHNIDSGEDFNTIQEAIDAVNTTDGHTITVDAGTYAENVIVNKSLTIQGASWTNTTIDGTGAGDVVNVTSNWVNISGFTVMNSGSGWVDAGIELYNVQNSRIEDINASNNYAGIYLYSSSNNTISDNNVSSNSNYGILLWPSSNYNTLTNNNASSQIIGIYISSSGNNTLTDNTANSNSPWGVYLVSSGGNTLTDNIATSNSNGFYITSSSNFNTLVNNTADSNTNYGIYLTSSNSNLIYHNNFIGNTNQAFDDGVNRWNETYANGGGNYWSDHLFPNNFNDTARPQTSGGPDWFTDTNYAVPGGLSEDAWPHTWPNGWLQPTPVHNLDSGTDYAMIGEALQFANPGDRVQIEDRPYNENVVIDKNVKFVDSDFTLNGSLNVGASGFLVMNNISTDTGMVSVDAGGKLYLENSPNTIKSENVWIDGSVWVNSSKWEMNNSFDGEYDITVNGTGEMYIQSSPDLIGQWQFDEGTGQTAYDSSKIYTNHGTLGSTGGPDASDPAWVSGKFGGGLDFDGIDDYVDLGSVNYDVSNGLTFSIWAEVDSVKDWARFFELGQGPSNDNIIFARWGANNELAFQLYNGAVMIGSVITNTNPLAGLSGWNHFAVTMDSNGDVVIYKNGVPIRTGTTGIPANVPRTSSFIGKSNWANDYYDGKLDDARIYSRSLTSFEIMNLYNSINPNGSTIKAVDPNFNYRFIVNSGATFQVENSTIQDAGWDPANPGLKIYTSNVKISYANIISNYRGVSLDSASNVLIMNSNISNNYIGLDATSTTGLVVVNTTFDSNTWTALQVLNTNSMIVRDNSFKTNWYGINLGGSNSQIINNTIDSSVNSGILVNNRPNNKIYDNDISNSGKGIQLLASASDNTLIRRNTINNNNIGIHLNDASGLGITGTEITNNTVRDSTGTGILIDGHSGNFIYHNNIINNNVQADDDSTNTWNLGYAQGGNYWDDWTTPDINWDFFTDSPRLIPGGSGMQDDLPHTVPFGWTNFHPGQKVLNWDQGLWYPTLASAATNATSGDTLKPLDNTYFGDVTVDGKTVFIQDSSFNLTGQLVIKNGGALIVDPTWWNQTGNIWVDAGSTLTLIDTVLRMNNAFDGQYNITVNGTGTIEIIDNGVGPSTIMSNTTFKYGFVVKAGATFRVENSTVQDVGWSGLPDQSGVDLKNDDVYIYNGSFKNNWYGVYLEGDNNVVILNSNFSSNRMDGIHMAGSDNNLFIGNNNSFNSRSGWFIRTSSDNNIIRDGNASDNTQNGLYVEASESNLVQNLSFWNNGNGVFMSNIVGVNNYTSNNFNSNINGLAMRNSDLAQIRFNDFKNSVARAINIFGSSDSNYIGQNNFTSTMGTTAIYLNTFIGLRPSNTIIDGNNFTVNPRAIWLNGADDTTISNNLIDASSVAGILAVDSPSSANWELNTISNSPIGVDASNSTFTMVNCTFVTNVNEFNLDSDSYITTLNSTFNKGLVVYNDALSELEIQWYLDVYVRDTLLQAVPGAQVEITDVMSTQVYDTLAGGDAWARWLILTEYIENQAGQTSHTLHLVVANNGLLSGSGTIFMDQSKSMIVTIDSYAPPTVVTVSSGLQYDFYAPEYDIVAIVTQNGQAVPHVPQTNMTVTLYDQDLIKVTDNASMSILDSSLGIYSFSDALPQPGVYFAIVRAEVFGFDYVGLTSFEVVDWIQTIYNVNTTVNSINSTVNNINGELMLYLQRFNTTWSDWDLYFKAYWNWYNTTNYGINETQKNLLAGLSVQMNGFETNITGLLADLGGNMAFLDQNVTTMDTNMDTYFADMYTEHANSQNLIINYWNKWNATVDRLLNDTLNYVNLTTLAINGSLNSFYSEFTNFWYQYNWTSYYHNWSVSSWFNNTWDLVNFNNASRYSQWMNINSWFNSTWNRTDGLNLTLYLQYLDIYDWFNTTWADINMNNMTQYQQFRNITQWFNSTWYNIDMGNLSQYLQFRDMTMWFNQTWNSLDTFETNVTFMMDWQNLNISAVDMNVSSMRNAVDQAFMNISADNNYTRLWIKDQWGDLNATLDNMQADVDFLNWTLQRVDFNLTLLQNDVDYLNWSISVTMDRLNAVEANLTALMNGMNATFMSELAMVNTTLYNEIQALQNTIMTELASVNASIDARIDALDILTTAFYDSLNASLVELRNMSLQHDTDMKDEVYLLDQTINDLHNLSLAEISTRLNMISTNLSVHDIGILQYLFAINVDIMDFQENINDTLADVIVYLVTADDQLVVIIGDIAALDTAVGEAEAQLAADIAEGNNQLKSEIDSNYLILLFILIITILSLLFMVIIRYSILKDNEIIDEKIEYLIMKRGTPEKIKEDEE